MSSIVVRCRKSYYKEQWVVVVAEENRVNHGKTNIKEWAGQSVSSLVRIVDDRGRWAAITIAKLYVGMLQQRLDVTEIG